ncbi:MAG: hypothetical protein WBV82_22910 [Myxococcaceae bacterium]
MKRFEQDGLTIAVKDDPANATVDWLGTSDSRDPTQVLSPYLDSLVDELKGKSVTVDFRKFEYMNSATVSPLINFVKKLDANGIRTTLIFDGSLNWQRLNAQCLKALASMLSCVEVRS